MNRYVINILASRDLNEIAEYFSQNSLDAGEKFFRVLISLNKITCP
jgi:toxin ParE1/3/4